MKSRKNLVKLGLILLLFGNILFLPNISLATDNVNETKFTPQISIPDSEFQQGSAVKVGSEVGTKITSDLIGRYVIAFYKWGLSIGGVLAVLMLMAGGLIWLTSAGDSGKIGDAKKMISGSLLGTLLLVGAYFFLNTINPDLVNMPATTIDTTKKQEIEAHNDYLTTADKFKFVCLPSGMTCTNTNPPTMNIDLKACINKYGEMPNCNKNFDKTGYQVTFCCGLNENTQAKADNFCANKSDGTSCKINDTALDTSGYCLNKKCKTCLNYGTACNKNYECREGNFDHPRCGDKADGDCNSGYCANITEDKEGEPCGALNAGKCLEYNFGYVCPGSTTALSGGTSCDSGLKCCK